MQILKTVQKEEDGANPSIKEPETEKFDLLTQKQIIEERIKRLDKKNIDDKVINSLRKLQDVSDSVSDMQNSLNLAWKRIQQIEQELREALNISAG